MVVFEPRHENPAHLPIQSNRSRSPMEDNAQLVAPDRSTLRDHDSITFDALPQNAENLIKCYGSSRRKPGCELVIPSNHSWNLRYHHFFFHVSSFDTLDNVWNRDSLGALMSFVVVTTYMHDQRRSRFSPFICDQLSAFAMDPMTPPLSFTYPA